MTLRDALNPGFRIEESDDWGRIVFDEGGTRTMTEVERDLWRQRERLLQIAEAAEKALARLASKEAFNGALDGEHAMGAAILKELKARGRYAEDALAEVRALAGLREETNG